MSVLGIPIDYRLRGTIRKLRKLNEESASPPGPRSNHIEELRQLRQSIRLEELQRTDNEVEFACYLAEPAVQGGIVVALKQLPKSQNYDKSVEDRCGKMPNSSCNT